MFFFRAKSRAPIAFILVLSILCSYCSTNCNNLSPDTKILFSFSILDPPSAVLVNATFVLGYNNALKFDIKSLETDVNCMN